MFQEEDLFQEEDCCFRIKTVVLRGILLFSEEDCCFKRNIVVLRGRRYCFRGKTHFKRNTVLGKKTCVVSGGRPV